MDIFDTTLTAVADILILPAFAYYGLLPQSPDSGGKDIRFQDGERKEED